MNRRGRKTIFIFVLIGIIAGSAEFFAYVCTILIGNSYFAPEPTRIEYLKELQDQYKAENFDENLGWIALSRDREPDGTRLTPDNPVSGRPCLSLYGDSFVFGNDVSHTAAWANQLAKSLQCKVLNFGVGGYGTDQAYLRFMRNSSDPSKVVMLGMLTENIVRNVNQNRAFLYGNSGVGPLKPILWLDEGERLHTLPVPTMSADSYEQYIKNPAALFTKEFFIPDSSLYAEQRVHFPYSINLIRALRYKRVYYGLLYYITKGLPWYQDFYDPSHPSHALQITEAILAHFAQQAKDQDKTAIIIFLPTSRDIENYLKTGKWIYDKMFQWCEDKGYNCFDAGSAMIEKLNREQLKVTGICEYFCTESFAKGHYNEKGNKLLAEVSLMYLKEFLPEAKVLLSTPNDQMRK